MILEQILKEKVARSFFAESATRKKLRTPDSGELEDGDPNEPAPS
jgi:hypothetical protein